MKRRNPVIVVILGFITLGIYQIFWFVTTRNAMKRLGIPIPTAWLIIIPFVNIWWLWKYSQGVEMFTGRHISAVMAFWLVFLLEICGFGCVSNALLQNEFNRVFASSTPITPESPAAPLAA